MSMTRFACVIVVLVFAAGCSSDRRASHSTESCSSNASRKTLVSAASARDAAISLGERMLDEAVLPSGARSFAGLLPAGLRCPFLQGPDFGNLVYAHRLWTVNEAPQVVSRWLGDHAPKGFVGGGGGSVGEGAAEIWIVAGHVVARPANISEALMQLSIGGAPSGPAVVRIDTMVGWTAPRPADEFVSSRDHVVIVTVIHIYKPYQPGKRVVTTNPNLVQPIASTFNHLSVEPPPGVGPGGFGGCGGPASFTDVAYRVVFATSATAAADLVATVSGECVGVEVTVNGRSAPALLEGPSMFVNDVAHVVGLAEPHWG